MVNKRYMQKCDTCVGHEARINKLLLKKPPGLMSASGVSLGEPLRAIKEKRGRREMLDRKMQKMDRGRRRTQSPALGIESSETGGVPRVRLESVI